MIVDYNDLRLKTVRIAIDIALEKHSQKLSNHRYLKLALHTDITYYLRRELHKEDILERLAFLTSHSWCNSLDKSELMMLTNDCLVAIIECCQKFDTSSASFDLVQI